MWHDIVLQADRMAQMASFDVVDLAYRFPIVFGGTVMSASLAASALCFDIAKAWRRASRSDFEQADERPVRLPHR